MDSETKAPCVERAAKGRFRPGIDRADAGHHA